MKFKEVKRNNKMKCKFCSSKATYGYNKQEPERCERHKEEDMKKLIKDEVIKKVDPTVLTQRTEPKYFKSTPAPWAHLVKH